MDKKGAEVEVERKSAEEEEKGIAEEHLEICDKFVKIPMTGTFQSLNVSVAAGIILFEIVKQRM